MELNSAWAGLNDMHFTVASEEVWEDECQPPQWHSETGEPPSEFEWLKVAGFTATELTIEGFDVSTLAAAGFTAFELRAAGFHLEALTTLFGLPKLVTAGFTVSELIDEGYDIA